MQFLVTVEKEKRRERKRLLKKRNVYNSCACVISGAWRGVRGGESADARRQLTPPVVSWESTADLICSKEPKDMKHLSWICMSVFVFCLEMRRGEDSGCGHLKRSLERQQQYVQERIQTHTLPCIQLHKIECLMCSKCEFLV